jgi:HTH-type transcriptional regulator/antitoxin MqsA
MTTVRETAEIKIGNRGALVEVERSRCHDCGEIIYTPEQMDAAQTAAAEKIRQEDGLLSSSEIRSIRAQYGLTQAQLERLLGVGPKTVVRWERGTVFQSRTADELLRIISSIPAAFGYLARKNGIDTVTVEPIVRGKTQVSRYVFHSYECVRAPMNRVVDLTDFVAGAMQQKKVNLERREAVIADIALAEAIQ